MTRRIETKTSRTAEMTCMMRCLSYLEKRAYLKSDDDISIDIVNDLVKRLIRLPLVRKYFFGFFPTGMYEYVIARTKYIDAAVLNALSDGTRQILILGAGFDSRGIRFGDQLRESTIFELDAPVTQNAKIERYKEKGIKIPKNLVFVQIDFDRQSIAECLTACGFEKGKKSLFILEGLTMYLQPQSVDSLFRLLSDLAGPGSAVVFDFIYASVVRRENLYEGEKALTDKVSEHGEGFTFGIEKGDAGAFLIRYGLEAVDIMDAGRIRETFFTDGDGRVLAEPNGTHCLVTAVKKE